MSELKTVSDQKLFEGRQIRVEHTSQALNCTMQFSVYIPPQAAAALPPQAAAADSSQAAARSVPALYWLSGLTCTDENFSTKAGAQRLAAELGIALIIPDTSPRGDDVADDEAYDMGKGAGFYLNATEEPWSHHYRMYDYIVDELPRLVERHFPVSDRRAISGHSMGGHGAMTIALKNPQRFVSVSAFSPIVNPMQCSWGQKAFTHYLGEDRDAWAAYDSVELIRSQGLTLPLLVDQGTADNFLEEQLLTDKLISATQALPNVTVRYQDGYDHSYYFISTFIDEHLRFHGKHLNA